MLNPGFDDLSVAELKKIVDTQAEKDYMLIDVRQPDECAQAHIPGSKLIPPEGLSCRLPRWKKATCKCWPMPSVGVRV